MLLFVASVVQVIGSYVVSDAFIGGCDGLFLVLHQVISCIIWTILANTKNTFILNQHFGEH